MPKAWTKSVKRPTNCAKADDNPRTAKALPENVPAGDCLVGQFASRVFPVCGYFTTLPAHLENSLWFEIDEMEKEMKMEYITSVQRIGEQIGREKGRREEAEILLGRLISMRFNIARADWR